MTIADLSDAVVATREPGLATTGWPPVVAAVDVDVTRLRRALGDRAHGPALTAVLTQVVARRFGRCDGLRPRAAGAPSLGVRVGRSDELILVPDATHLTVTGLIRRIAAGPHHDGRAPEIVLTHSGAAGLAWEIAPAPAGTAVSLTVGAISRQVQVVDDVDGAESIAVRSTLRAILCHDDRLSRHDAMRHLAAFRADLEQFDVDRLVAELWTGATR